MRNKPGPKCEFCRDRGCIGCMTQTPINKYKDWIKEGNIYRNTITGEKSIWHPFTLSIGESLYQNAKTWCQKTANDKNHK